MNEFSEDEVGEVFESVEAVELAYVFGSVARGEAGELSDVDLAVYLDESVDESDYFDVELELRKRLSSLIGGEVDLVVMNDASLLLNYNVISEGSILFKESDEVKVRVESGILNRYLDRRYYDQRHVDERLEKFAERGLA